MDDAARLLAEFDSGRLVRPSAREPGFMDLVAAVAAVTGVTDAAPGDAARSIAARLASAEHLVLVLADGVGLSLLERLPSGSWLRRHLDRPLLAAYPSTTAVAVTSIATGHWVTEHAAVGWWTYLPALGEAAVILPFHRLADEKPLESLGIDSAQAFPLPPMIASMQRDAAVVFPANIADSPYSRYLSGGAARFGYERYDDAIERVASRIEQSGSPTYTYFYTPRVDTEAHEQGAEAPATLAALADLDAALAALHERLNGRARIAVTSDHGHLDVPEDGRRLLERGDQLLAPLRFPPTGDVRVLYFHLAESAGAADRRDFEALFRRRYGERWLLLTTGEVDSLRLFGPDSLSAETCRRMGDYTAIGITGDVMRYAGVPGSGRFLRQRSQHSGLSRDEMLIPLVIA